MAADPTPEQPGLGGRAALSAFRAARAASRQQLRTTLKADRSALRTARLGPTANPAPAAAAAGAAMVLPAGGSVFAGLVEAERIAAPARVEPAAAAAGVILDAAMIEALAAQSTAGHDSSPEPAPVDAQPLEQLALNAAPELEVLAPPPLTAIASEGVRREAEILAPVGVVPVAVARFLAEPVLVEPTLVDPVLVEPVLVEPVLVEHMALPTATNTAEASDETLADTVFATEAATPAAEAIPARRIAPDATLDAIEELGPGMRHRLGLLGYRTCGDLAAAEPSRLSQQLGEISRLLRIERWIAAARAIGA